MKDDHWARAAEDMSKKPYKLLAISLLTAARQDRADAKDTFVACSHAIETAQRDNPNFGSGAVKRCRADAVNQSLARPLMALDRAIQENDTPTRDVSQARAAMDHPRAMRAEAAVAKHGTENVHSGASGSAMQSNGLGLSG